VESAVPRPSSRLQSPGHSAYADVPLIVLFTHRHLVWQRPRWLPPFGALRLLGHAEKDWTSRPSAGRAILARLAAHGARLPPVSSGVLIARWGVAGSSRWRVAPASPPRLSEREVIGGAPAALKPSASRLQGCPAEAVETHHTPKSIHWMVQNHGQPLLARCCTGC
jgi:hypothetical protein